MSRRACLAVLGVLLGAVPPSEAQQRDSFPPNRGDMSPAEVQQLFDAFELVRAEEMLGLTEEQYPQFVVRLKTLQDSRREAQRERQMLLRELRRLLGQSGVGDAELEERLEALRTQQQESAARQAAAIEQIDSILDVRQRVRFRMFQQAMEQRRLELLMRARRGQTPRQPRQPRDRF